MSQIFNSLYAQAYDHFYTDKDYDAECVVIEKLAGEVLGPGPYRLLDLGCGTGNHAVPLTRRGHAVTGVDLSEEMLKHARNKAVGLEGSIDFCRSNIRGLSLEREYDAVLMMFAVMGYQTTNEALLAALASTRRHLRQDGAFIFDIWFGPAVLMQKPERRFRAIQVPGGEILRAVDSEIDVLRQICTVNYQLWAINGETVTGRASEQHVMRYFFPLELEALLAQSGFRLLRLGQFEAPDRKPDTTSWNVIGLAQAV